MAGSAFEITIEDKGVLLLLAELQPRAMNRRVHGALVESTAYVQTSIQHHFPVDTGLGRQSITSAVRGATLDQMRGVVFSPLIHVAVVDQGRRPGRFPPRGPIERWAARVVGGEPHQTELHDLESCLLHLGQDGAHLPVLHRVRFDHEERFLHVFLHGVRFDVDVGRS